MIGSLESFASGACAVIVALAVGLHRPSQTELPQGPNSPPTTWPDYSLGGPGFVAPDGADGDLIAYGYKLVTETFSLIGPEACQRRSKNASAGRSKSASRLMA